MNQDLDVLFTAHLAEVRRRTDRALTAHGFDAVAIYSGQAGYSFLDDFSYPFRVNPHFKQWAPLTDVQRSFVAYDTWTAAMSEALADLPVEVVAAASDEGRWLVAHITRGLGVAHAPDVMHAQRDLHKALGQPLANSRQFLNKLIFGPGSIVHPGLINSGDSYYSAACRLGLKSQAKRAKPTQVG